MEKEKIIQELIEISKVKGYVAVKEVKRYVDENSDDFDEVITELEKNNVDVVSEEEMISYKIPKLTLDEDDDDDLDLEEDDDIDSDLVLDLDFAKDIEEELLHDKSF
ncbi:MAG: RNA polymerase sigma factor region1.1 domain-containing protein, partial [Candidatus Izemoplasmataceae bacterium]